MIEKNHRCSPIAIRADSVTKSFYYGDAQFRAVDEVSVQFRAFELSVISGPSGCGKTTLLHLLGGLTHATAGSVCVLGEIFAAQTMSIIRRKNIGFVFQDAGLIDGMDAESNVELPLMYRRLNPRERKKLSHTVLEQLGMAAHARRDVSLLSGGERQRVGLARAIALRPAILICDEPTASLSRIDGKNIISLLASIAQSGTAVICSSHDPALIERADWAVTMLHGKVITADASSG